MIRMWWLATLLWAAVAAVSAAFADGPLERIEPRLARAIEENRVFLTCTSLDPAAFESAQRYWMRMVARARAQLEAKRASAEDLAAFDRRTAVSALVPADRPLSEAIALCRAHSDWFKRYGRFDFISRIDDSPLPPGR